MTVKIKDVTDGFIKEIELLKTERDALAAQNKILLDALNLALPSVEACYKQHMATWETLFLLREAAKATPQQCLRDVQAEAGRAGFIAGFNESGEGFNGEYGASEKRIYQLADEHAAKVRQGGAE